MLVKKKNNKIDLLLMKKFRIKFCLNMIYVQYRILYKYIYIGIYYFIVQMQGMMGMMMLVMYIMLFLIQIVVINNNVWNINNVLMFVVVSQNKYIYKNYKNYF